MEGKEKRRGKVRIRGEDRKGEIGRRQGRNGEERTQLTQQRQIIKRANYTICKILGENI